MIISRYLTKEIVQTLLAVLLVLLLIVVGRHFVIVLNDAASGRVAAEVVLELLFLRTLTALNVMVPFALFIAVMVAFGRLYKDSEMVAMSASGIGPGRVLKAVGVVALVCSVLVSGISFWLSPWANEKMLQVQEEAQSGTPFAAVEAGRFTEIGDDSVFYVEGLSEDRARLNDVFIQSYTDGLLDVFSARSGYQYVDPKTHIRYLVLVDGFRYQGLPDDPEYKIHQYEKYAVRLDELNVSPLQRQRFAIPSQTLWSSSSPADRAELHWRLAMPLAALLLPLLGVFLSRTSPRQGRFAKLFIAVFVFIIYYNSLGLGMSWMERGLAPPILGLWWVHIIMSLLILVFAVRHWGGRWLWYRLVQGRAV